MLLLVRRAVYDRRQEAAEVERLQRRRLPALWASRAATKQVVCQRLLPPGMLLSCRCSPGTATNCILLFDYFIKCRVALPQDHTCPDGDWKCTSDTTYCEVGAAAAATG